jgi:hypothetical protein
MVRNDILRKRYAKRSIDDIIHDNLASVSKSLGPQQALERLLVYVPNRTDLLSPMPLGGEPSWTRAAYFFKGLVALAHNQAHWLRDVAIWEPNGDSTRRQFGSLARHLLANHVVPNFMDLVWFIDPSKEARRRQKWFRHIGRGGGINGTDIPVRLTKAMVHHFMHAPDHYTVEEAFRWGQILGFGGEPALVKAVNSTRLARDFDHEAYWAKVIEFFVRHAELVIGHVGPIVEYLRFQKHFYKLEPPLPEKRKAVMRLLEQVAKWQPPTRATSSTPSIRWDSMGIKGLEYDETQRWSHRTWTIRELLDSNELTVEGRAMRHCVARYVGRCAKQRSSIWSMTCYSCVGHEHVLTIEVDPGTRTIVQAKGKRDSYPSPEGRRIMLTWARQEGLKVASHV